MSSAQALLPNRPTLGDALQSLVNARDVVVTPPNIVVADGELFAAETRTSIKFAQNCAVEAVKYKIGSAITGPDDFHGILAGGDVEDDGLGSVIDLSKIQDAIYIEAVSGAPRVATVLAYYNA